MQHTSNCHSQQLTDALQNPKPEITIKKISDIKNAKTPNIHDSGSASTGLSGSYAKAILNGNIDATYQVPLDADDLSRCVVAIEQFKSQSHLSQAEIQRGLERLRNSSCEWEGIFADYNHLKSMFMMNASDAKITDAMRAAMNKVISKEIIASKMNQAERIIRSVDSKSECIEHSRKPLVSLQTSDVHLINACIIAAANCSHPRKEPTLLDPKISRDREQTYNLNINVNSIQISHSRGWMMQSTGNIDIHNLSKHHSLFGQSNKSYSKQAHQAAVISDAELANSVFGKSRP